MLHLLKAFCLCCIFMAAGPALILLNKHIMQELRFPYPMFLSGLGVLSAGSFAALLVNVKVVILEKQDEVRGVLYLKRIVPIAVAYSLTLALGNVVYLYLEVGFVQMLKSFTPVVIMIGLYLSGIEIPSRSVVFSISVISLGTAMTCTYSPHSPITGILIMLMSEIFESVRLILSQFLLKDLKFSVIESQYILAPASGCCLFVLSVFLEIPLMIENNAFSILFDQASVFVYASLLGLTVNYLSYFVIQATSSLTLKVLGTLRNIFVIVAGVFVYKEKINSFEAVGYVLALIGFVW